MGRDQAQGHLQIPRSDLLMSLGCGLEGTYLDQRAKRDGRYLELLRATLAHAMSQVPYYRAALPSNAADLDSLRDFAALPLLRRADIDRLGQTLVAGGTLPDFIRNTSGSTFSRLGRRPMVTYHMESEAAASKELHDRVGAHGHRPKPLMLRMLSIDHGVDPLGSVPGVFAVPLAKPAHFAHVRQLLEAQFTFAGFSNRILGLSATLTRLKILTLACIRAGVEASAFALQFIGSSSQLLTPRWARILRSYWEVEVTEYYGLSEIPGLVGARCPECRGYHLSPSVYIEMLDPISLEPTTSGVAKLVATGLVPLMSKHPLIRYDTEDLVVVLPPCPVSPQPALEYVGREADAVLESVPEGTVLLVSPAALHAQMDEEPDISIDPSTLSHPFDLDGVGQPKYLLGHTRKHGLVQISVTAELRWPPDLYPERATELCRRVRSQMLATSQPLADAVEAGRALLDVRVVAPGQLAQYTDV